MMVNPRRLLGLLLGATIVLCLNPRQTTAAFCDVNKKVSNNNVPLPNPFGYKYKAYSMQIQMNYITKNQTIWGEEYYDQTQNKVFMTYTMNGSRIDYILNYQDQYIAQTYTKAGVSVCEIDPLLSSQPNDNFHFFGKVKVTGGSVHPYSISQVFDMGEPSKFFYVDDSSNIDGVSTDHWSACLSWPDDNDVFKLDYYFSRTSATNQNYDYYPVQAKVQGEKTKDGTTTPLHMVYEYFNFVPAVSLDPAIFDIPQTVQCADTNNLVTKAIPNLPDEFKLMFQAEVIDIKSNTVNTKDYIYDPINKIIVTMQGLTKLIDDFNTNVHFEITFGKRDANCRTLDINAGDFSSATSSKVRMKTPDELLSIDDKDKFQYLGTLYDRSIRADIWKLNERSITYAHGAAGSKSSVPMSVISPTTRINVLDFHFNRTHDIGKMDPFDITACKSQSQLKNIRITFVSNEYSINTDYLFEEDRIYLTHEAIQTMVAQALKISPLHVHWIDMFSSEGEGEIYWDAVLVGPDVKESSKFPYKNVSDIFNNLKTIVNSQVLSLDLETGRYQWSAKSTVTASRIDDLSTLYSKVVSKIGPLSKFTKYAKKRTYSSPVVKGTVTTADNCASLCLDEQTFECRSILFCSSTKECLRYNDFDTPYLSDSDECDFYSRQLTADFYKEPGYFLKPRGHLLYENLPNDNDCASMCLKETTIFCRSFSYCAESGECFLEKHHRERKFENQATDKPVCQHYSRQFIADYTVSVNTAVTSTDTNHPLEREDGESSEACAFSCSARASVDGCGQFDYCPSTKECHFVSNAASKYAVVVNSAFCTTYTSKKVSPGQSAKATSSNNSKSYGGGSMAVLGVIMALIGVTLGGVVFFFLSRRQAWTVR